MVGRQFIIYMNMNVVIIEKAGLPQGMGNNQPQVQNSESDTLPSQYISSNLNFSGNCF